ncbi:MAG: AbrB/MazE/SpoVT family DNA-binding domain-containing protein [bacterium]|nr:AbrB/MazE/SpoVT family DNA-binding domain-containing protein [bacterium]
MSDTSTVIMGERGRIVVPAAVRERAGFSEGTTLMILETPNGVVLMTRDQLLARVRSELRGLDLVSELLADRRRAAEIEDADMAGEL